MPPPNRFENDAPPPASGGAAHDLPASGGAAHDLPASGGAAHDLPALDARLRLLVDGWAQAVWETDAEGRVIADSPSWRAYTGQTLEQWLGWGWLDAVHPDDRATVEASWREAIATQGPVDHEYRLHCADGRWCWTHVRAMPLIGADGRVERWVGINVDVDMRRSAVARQGFVLELLDALRGLDDPTEVKREACRRLRVHLRGAGRVVYATCSGDDIRIAALDAEPDGPDLPERLHVAGFGAGLAAALRSGRPIAQADVTRDPLLSPAQRAQFLACGVAAWAVAPLVARGEPIAMLAVHYPAAHAWGADEIELLRETAERTWTAAARARAASALRRSEERLRVALSAARLGTWLWDLRSGRHQPDAAMRELLGLRADACLERFEDLLQVIHPADREPVRERVLEAIARRDGFTVEYRVVDPGGEDRWIRDRGQVFTDAAGEPLSVAGACLDITERKAAELALQRADRTKTEFLAMLAHELRNPLAPLRTSVALLERDPGDALRAGTAIGIMRRQVEHLGRLVDDLLEVSRIEHGKIELRVGPTSIARALRSAVEIVQPALDERRQRLETTLPDDSVRIDADAERITQVVANLLHNASKFSPDGRLVTLHAEVGAEWVTIVVRDEGRGIPPDVLPHVFELFDQGRTPSVDRSRGGLGIGLALVRRLVHLHGGRVRGESEGEGRGATFTVTLPRERRSADRGSA